LKKLNELAITEPDGTNSLSKKLFDTIAGYGVARECSVV